MAACEVQDTFTRPAVIGYRAFWAFALVSWILAIIALASVQAQCYGISGSYAVYKGEERSSPARLCTQ